MLIKKIENLTKRVTEVLFKQVTVLFPAIHTWADPYTRLTEASACLLCFLLPALPGLKQRRKMGQKRRVID